MHIYAVFLSMRTYAGQVIDTEGDTTKACSVIKIKVYATRRGDFNYKYVLSSIYALPPII